MKTETEDIRNPNPTSTYKGVLMNAINAVIFYKNLGNYQGTIEALSTLKCLLVPPVTQRNRQHHDIHSTRQATVPEYSRRQLHNTHSSDIRRSC